MSLVKDSCEQSGVNTIESFHPLYWRILASFYKGNVVSTFIGYFILFGPVHRLIDGFKPFQPNFGHSNLVLGSFSQISVICIARTESGMSFVVLSGGPHGCVGTKRDHQCRRRDWRRRPNSRIYRPRTGHDPRALLHSLRHRWLEYRRRSLRQDRRYHDKFECQSIVN